MPNQINPTATRRSQKVWFLSLFFYKGSHNIWFLSLFVFVRSQIYDKILYWFYFLKDCHMYKDLVYILAKYASIDLVYILAKYASIDFI